MLHAVLFNKNVPKKVFPSLLCPFQACVAPYVTGRSGWMDGGCVHCLPACLCGGREGGRRKGEGALLLLARSLARSLPPPSLGVAAARSRTPSPSPLSLSSACLPAALPPRSSSASFSALHLCLGARSVRTVARSRVGGGCNNTR